MLTHISLLLSLHGPRDSQHLSCWLMNPCRLSLYCHAYEIHSICHAGSWIPAACPYTALPTRFTASVVLAHESLPPVFILPCLRDSLHLSCWLMNPCRLSLYCPAYEIHSICHAGSWIPAACLYTALPTRFTAPVMLAHESPPPLLYCPVHEIHFICHADSWISAASPILPCPRDSQHLSCWLMDLFRYAARPTRFTASVMLAHESPPPVVIQPCPRDSQHLSCWLMNLHRLSYTALSTNFTASVMQAHESRRLSYTALSTRFTASVMLAHESLLLSLHRPNPEIHSICHAGPWISAASINCPVHEIHSICHAGSWISTVFHCTVPSPSHTSVILAQESLPLYFYCPIHGIHSILHVG
jgi:hypothetical protein